MSDFDDKVRQWLKNLFGDTNERRLKDLQPYLERTSALEPEYERLSDDELKGKTAQFKQIIDNALKDVPDIKLIPDDAPKMPGRIRTQKDKVLGEVLEELMPQAFAAVRETSKRVLHMRHFDVQVLGGAALHFNKIAEMRTGEGKTLVATMPIYLNALAGRGAHVVTVNDYLSGRDSEWMGAIYRYLGLSVGLVYSHQPDYEKMAAYRADITYGTNHEFGFDYLRDNMRTSIEDLVQRPYYYAIVDEVDNILIDEARTPLIISGAPAESFTEIYKRMAQLAPLMEKGRDKDDEDCDYWVDEKGRNVLITERGVINAEKLLGVETLFDMHFNFHHHLVQALKAKELFQLDKEYVIHPNEQGVPEVVIVDEFTGRMMIGRRWSDGLHQAVEAKEAVPIQEETMTFASITYQNLFRLYPKLAGMTGTAMTEAAEFNKIYNLDVVAVPTNKESIRTDHSDVIYKTERQKYYSVIEEIVEMHEQGRPVLVGTVSIEKSELISELLSKPHKMNEYLVSKMTKVMEYIKQRDLSGEAITALKKIFERPGLVEPDKLEAVINKIEAEFKKHEELLERLYSVHVTAQVLAAIRKGVPHHVLNAKHHEKEAMIVAQAGRKGAVTVATNMAGRGTDILLGGNPEYLAKEEFKDDELDHESAEYQEKIDKLTKKFKVETDAEHEEVVKLGGLHIIGTERHESRRIDNQLRGRAGRQGDPGSARFFLSLEDSLMRIFGGEKIAKLMDMIGADEEMPIEHKMVTRSIENAQKKVEAHHFDMRKHVLQYDDVLNTQREVIYRERRRILENMDLRENIVDMLEEHVDLVLNAYITPETPPEVWEEEGLPELLGVLENDVPMLAGISINELSGLSYEDLRDKLQLAVRKAYEVREEEIGKPLMRNLERQILLRTIDMKWVDYLHNIEILREGVGLRGYGQRDPLQEYKREAFDMFNMLLRQIQTETVHLLFHAQPLVQEEPLPGELPEELLQLLAEHGITPEQLEGEIKLVSPEELMLGAAAQAGDAQEEADDSSEDLRTPHPEPEEESEGPAAKGDAKPEAGDQAATKEDSVVEVATTGDSKPVATDDSKAQPATMSDEKVSKKQTEEQPKADKNGTDSGDGGDELADLGKVDIDLGNVDNIVTNISGGDTKAGQPKKKKK